MSNIIEKYVYICPLCKTQYDEKHDAEDCLNSTEKPLAKVGDIVELKYGFGWYDGKKSWVINPDVDTRKHGFGSDCSIGFYYVITHIEIINHRIKYHVATNAMTGNQGHKGGYTHNTRYCTPKPIEAPAEVLIDSKSLIGLKFNHLI